MTAVDCPKEARAALGRALAAVAAARLETRRNLVAEGHLIAAYEAMRTLDAVLGYALGDRARQTPRLHPPRNALQKRLGGPPDRRLASPPMGGR